MMILKHPRIEKEIEFNDKQFYYLCIENAIEYRTMILQLTNQITDLESFYLFDNDDILNLTKSMFFIDNPAYISFDEKKLNLMIQKEVANGISVEENETYLELVNRINDYIASITYDYPLRLTFDSEMNLLTFLKTFSLGYGGDNEDFLLTLIEKIKILVEVFKYKIIVLHNLCYYLSKEEFDSFVSEMRKLEIPFLIVSSHMPIYKNNEEIIIHIDSDLCELHIEQNIEK